MWKNQQIKDVSAASVVELKAELFKMSQKFEKDKQKHTEGQTRVVTDGRKITAPQKPDSRRNQKHSEDLETAGSAIEASWVSLQRKTQEYEKMKDNVNLSDDDDEESDVLLDFVAKSIKDQNQKKKDVPSILLDDVIFFSPADTQTNDPWIEIQDAFGRTRLVRKSALQTLDPEKNDYEGISPNASTLPENSLDAVTSGNIHYNNKKEIRTMGVGFYQFSKNEQERQAQMAKLKDLRQSTVQEREKTTFLKESKKEAKEARKRLLMEKINERKKAKTDSHPEFDDLFRFATKNNND